MMDCQEAEPVGVVVQAYKVGYNEFCPVAIRDLPAVYRQWSVFGEVPGTKMRVMSDCYCPDALKFWQRITRTYVIQRVHVYRSVGPVRR